MKKFVDASLFGTPTNAPEQRIEGSGGGCFLAGTAVATPSGNIPIEELNAGDEIWAFDEQGHIKKAEVKERHFHEEDTVYHVEFWGGEFYITANHWVLNDKNAFVEMGVLGVEDTLVDLRGHLRPIKTITEYGKHPVYNLTVEPCHTYIANGIRVHNGGGGKGGGGSQRAAVESPNTLRSTAIARVVDLIGEGPIRGLVNGLQSVFFDGTPVENEDGSLNFQGFKYDTRLGFPDQEYMPGFSEIETEQVVETEVTRENGRIVRQINNLNVDAVRVRIRIPNLSSQNIKTGDLKPTSVEFRIEVKPDGGNWQRAPFTFEEVDRSEETTTGNDAVSFSFSAQKTVLAKLNSTISDTIQAQYRKVGDAAWIDLDERDIVKQVVNVGDIDSPDGFIDGENAYNQIVSTSYTVSNLSADNYEVQVLDSGTVVGLTAYKTADTLVQGKNTSPTEKSYRFDLPGDGPWQIGVTRVTADSEKVSLQNSTVWAAYTEIIEEKFIYPDSAYIGFAINSELFGNKVPKRAYEVYGREVQVPQNYDPVSRSYTGFWDGTFKTAWTDNPAWCFMDMIVNDRFGLGQTIFTNNLDTTELYQISQYCDQLVPDGRGGLEPRFTFNAVINTSQDAYLMLNTLVSSFRGMIYWASGNIAFSQDSPRSMDVIVGRANVIDGEFSYEQAGERARHNSVYVTWNDPNDQYRPAIEVVELNDDIASRGLKQTDVVAFGCTSRGQAHRFGKWVLFTEMYEKELVRYRASLDHLSVQPGMIVGVVDPHRSGAEFAGRTLDIDGVNITLDREVTLAAGETYQLAVVDDEGDVQYKDILTLSGTTDTLLLNGTFDPVPTKGKMWSIIGTDVEPKEYRVLGIVEIEPHIFEITAVEYNEGKYAYVENNVAFEPGNFTRFTTGQVIPPTGLDIQETLYLANNQVKTRLTISWEGSTDTRVFFYRVVWRDVNADNFEEKYTSSEAIELNDIQDGNYDIFVYALADAGESIALKSLNYEVLGKTAPPGDVENLKVTRRVNGLFLQWDAVTDLDLTGYEIRLGTVWETGELVGEIIGTSIFVGLEDDQEYTVMVRAKDELGNLSTGITQVTSSVIAPQVVPVFDAVPQGDYISFRWDVVQGIGNEYEVREGRVWESGIFVTRGAGDEALVLDPQLATTYYMIKTVSANGLYSEQYRTASTRRALIPDRNEILKYNNRDDPTAGDYTGYTFNMESGPDDTLVLSEISTGVYAPYGEHYFDVNLDTELRARNWLETTLINISGSTGPTWAEATYAWSDASAQVTWLPTGDLDGASLQKVIAWKVDPEDEDLYGFAMQDGLIDFRATGPTASTFTEDTDTGGHYIYQDISGLDVATEYTLSVYIKRIPGQTARNARLMFYDSTNSTHRVQQSYDLDDVSTVSDHSGGDAQNTGATITYVGDGWYRLTLSGIIDDDGTNTDIRIFPFYATETPNTVNYTGDGSSGLIWVDPQFEAGSSATAFTTGATNLVNAPEDLQESGGTGWHDISGVFDANSAYSYNDGLIPSNDVNITYTMAKFGNGVYIGDLTELTYDVSIPSTFTVSFKFKTSGEFDNKRILHKLEDNTGGTNWIEIGYDQALSGFYAVDQNGNTITVPATLHDTEDFVFVALAQHSTKRALYYRSERAYTEGYQEEAYSALGTFDKIHLHNESL